MWCCVCMQGLRGTTRVCRAPVGFLGLIRFWYCTHLLSFCLANSIWLSESRLMLRTIARSRKMCHRSHHTETSVRPLEFVKVPPRVSYWIITLHHLWSLLRMMFWAGLVVLVNIFTNTYFSVLFVVISCWNAMKLVGERIMTSQSTCHFVVRLFGLACLSGCVKSCY